MLSNILETKPVEFSDLAQGLEYLRGKRTSQAIVPSSALEVTMDGLLVSKPGNGNEALQARLTDFSLDLLHGILKIPRTYAGMLDPQLHSTNINELLAKRISPLVIISEEGEQHHVVAVLQSQSVVLPHDAILGHLVSRNLPGRVLFAPGYMEARIAGSDAVEVLPQEAFSIEGLVLNSQLGLRKWPFEISTFLTRLICANGMVARRNILSGKLGLWAQSPQRLSEFLDRQLSAAMTVISSGLKTAIERMMGETVPEEEKRGLVEQVRRAAGVKFLEGLFEKAVTKYDHLNEVTSLAHRLEDRERKRRLWVLGGSILEQYLEN